MLTFGDYPTNCFFSHVFTRGGGSNLSEPYICIAFKQICGGFRALAPKSRNSDYQRFLESFYLNLIVAKVEYVRSNCEYDCYRRYNSQLEDLAQARGIVLEKKQSVRKIRQLLIEQEIATIENESADSN